LDSYNRNASSFNPFLAFCTVNLQTSLKNSYWWMYWIKQSAIYKRWKHSIIPLHDKYERYVSPVNMPYLEFILLAVNNDGTDLLVHEDEDSDEQCRDRAGQINPPRVLPEWHHQPATTRPSSLVGDERSLYFNGAICTVAHAHFRQKSVDIKELFNILAQFPW